MAPIKAAQYNRHKMHIHISKYVKTLGHGTTFPLVQYM